MRAASAVVLAGAVALGALGGCGSSDAGSDGGSDRAGRADADRTGPNGDPALIPLLLTVPELEAGLVEGDGRREQASRLPLCSRDELPSTWTSEASMLGLDPEPDVIGGVGESIVAFEPGGAEAWFATLRGCANLTSKDTLRYTELPDVGDEALVSVPAEYRQAVEVPLTIAVVRVGDRVVFLSGAVERDVLTDAVIERAVAKVAG